MGCKAFTESHVPMINITANVDGGTIERELEKANILLYQNLLHCDIREGRHFMYPSGK